MRLPLAHRLPRPRPPSALVQHLPRLVLRPLSHTPFTLQGLLGGSALSYLFRDALRDGEFDFLEGKHLKLEIRDLGAAWYFTSQGRRLRLSRHARADATIRGNLREFLLLAGRREDPDTLFFQRRLEIDGDTELGLEVKNMLDTLDLDMLPVPIRQGIERLAQLVA